MRQGAREVFGEAGSGVAREGAGVLQAGLEFLRAVCQLESLQLCRNARRVLADQDEITGVGDQNDPVEAPVFAHLSAVSGQPGVFIGRLDFDDAAFG